MNLVKGYAGSSWIIPLRRDADSSVRLVCFPYAGGGPSMYRAWASLAPSSIELLSAHLPGRESRMREEPAKDYQTVISALVDAVQIMRPMPTIFFGHSLGGLIAFAVARELEHLALAPKLLVLSGCSAPSVPSKLINRAHELPDDLFLERLRELGGMPEEVLASRELLELCLPTLRADFSLVEQARQIIKGKVGVPLLLFGGERDAEATLHEISQWRDYTEGRSAMRTFPGDHFFVNDYSEMVITAVLDAVGGAIARKLPVIAS